MMERKRYSLINLDLVAQCDLNAPMPEGFREWNQMVPVGLRVASRLILVVAV
ncbi:hypothetical protein [Marinobacter sp.]|jgi:antitoxin ChpS|uniref:hypothetical protein n=1 Tax=Marinobacter sp. TaxID=50741 RepID=UPI003A93CEE6